MNSNQEIINGTPNTEVPQTELEQIALSLPIRSGVKAGAVYKLCCQSSF